MPMFRIFTNDRGKVRGVPMYSALKGIRAASAEAAARSVDPDFGVPHFAPIVAVQWPVKTKEAKDWMAKHV
jgi:hypothetical protein